VSWFVKQALVNVASDLGVTYDEPKSREDWARLARQVGVKGIHIAERDTQRAKSEKPMGTFVNTWSVDGFVSEGLQPAELGWGTHETWMPENAGTLGPDAQAIYLLQPGAQYPRAHVVPDARFAIRLPGHAQRIDLDLGLLHRA
jgi:homospermidine synthase